MIERFSNNRIIEMSPDLCKNGDEVTGAIRDLMKRVNEIADVINTHYFKDEEQIKEIRNEAVDALRVGRSFEEMTYRMNKGKLFSPCYMNTNQPPKLRRIENGHWFDIYHPAPGSRCEIVLRGFKDETKTAAVLHNNVFSTDDGGFYTMSDIKRWKHE